MGDQLGNPGANQSRTASSFYMGRLRNGKLYCNCDLQAHCRTIQKQCANLGMKFWRCPKERNGEGLNKQCNFYVWVDDEAEARRWLAKHGPKDDPETPTNDSKNPQTPPSKKSPENPWTKSKTKSKRKRDPEDILDVAEADQGNWDAVNGDEPESPSRKVAKTTRFATASQTLTEKLKAATSGSLPTPETGVKAMVDLTTSPVELQRRESPELSPTPNPNRPRNRRSDKQSDLVTTILKIIRDDNIELKEATKTKIQLEIELELDAMKAGSIAREKLYKKTISTLSGKVDNFENLAELLTEGATLDDAVELSE